MANDDKQNVLVRGPILGLVLALAVGGVAHAGTPADEEKVTAEAGGHGAIPDFMLTEDREKKYVHAAFDPTAMVRVIFVTTHEDTIQVEQDDGSSLDLSSSSMDPSYFGHREGFVLENVEFGGGGRFNHPGIYYKVKFELVPREKDGNSSNDYLKDAYFGFDKFTVFDVRAGRQRVPFSAANMHSTGKQPLVYKPTLDVLFPKRQVGVAGFFSDPYHVIVVRAGVFNSAKQAVEQLQTMDQLLFAARAEFALQNLLSATGNNPLDTAIQPFRFQIGGGIANVKENFDPQTKHRWIGVDLALDLWLFSVRGELMFKDFYRSALPDGSQASDRGWGWYTDLTIHAWPGFLDVTGRIEQMDGDDVERGYSTTLSIDELSKQKKLWVTGGISFHPVEHARVDVNYVHRKELEGFSFKNDVFMVHFQLAL